MMARGLSLIKHAARTNWEAFSAALRTRNGLCDCYLFGVSLRPTAKVFANPLAWVHLWGQLSSPVI